MRVAVIGIGSIGLRHARNILALGHEAIATDSDDAALERACQLGARRGALKEADAVLICTPATTHAAVACDLLAHGYRGPLFVEKPLALSVDEAEIFAAWPHPTTMVGYMLRHHHMARAMRAMFRTPVTGRFFVHSDMSKWPGQSYGDPLLEYSHEIDLALWMGAPSTVSGASRSDHDAFFMLGGEWSIGIGWTYPKQERRWEISSGVMGYVESFDDQKGLGDQMYVDEIAHFLDCAARGVPTETPFADGMRVLDVIAKAEALASQAATR